MVVIDGYTIDIAKSEEHALDSQVTENPVEEGADISDHVRKSPQRVTIEGVVTDTPVGDVALLRTSSVPSAEFFAHLWEIRDSGEPVTVETDLSVFDNMVLESLSIPIEPDDALHFRAVFKEVFIVSADRALRVPIPRSAKKKKKGNKPSKTIEGYPPTYSMGGRRSSTLEDMARKVGL